MKLAIILLALLGAGKLSTRPSSPQDIQCVTPLACYQSTGTQVIYYTGDAGTAICGAATDAGFTLLCQDQASCWSDGGTGYISVAGFDAGSYQTKWTLARWGRDGGTLGADRFVTVDADAGPIDVTLPPSTGRNGVSYGVKRIDFSGSAVRLVASGSDSIEGATTYSLPAAQDSAFIAADGDGGWWVFQ